jgi:hypothetical protein
MPERPKVGSVEEAVAFEALGNWLAKMTAPTARLDKTMDREPAMAL